MNLPAQNPEAMTLNDLTEERVELEKKIRSGNATVQTANRLAKIRAAIHRIESVANKTNWD